MEKCPGCGAKAIRQGNDLTEFECGSRNYLGVFQVDEDCFINRLNKLEKFLEEKERQIEELLGLLETAEKLIPAIELALEKK